MRERRRIVVQGIVQGVGFRPFVYGLAQQHALVGQVHNDTAGVTIEAEGDAAALEAFTRAMREQPPALAVVERVAWEALPLHGDSAFVIDASQHGPAKQALVSPDAAVCDDCRRELFDPADRRYHYPFINCTNCGPRYSIIRDVPYDRPSTTMAAFRLCAACQQEYDDPGDRRFHAQPVACPVCGPHVRLVSDQQTIAAGQDARVLAEAQRLLADGAILAIKGLGGYHLACDAGNAAAVARLRARKRRWDKPFALMAADLAAAETVCEVDAAGSAALLDRRRPIVLLPRRPVGALAPAVAPRLNNLGLMLPYTPLHYLLFAEAPYQLLVMTSGNASDEPIAFEDDDAFKRLAALADAFLTHDRAIHTRVDDSVVRVVPLPAAVCGQPMADYQLPITLRRARGYAPQPLAVPFEFRQPVLAVGAHLKNTFCLGKGRYALLSPHIGDLDNLETLLAFRAGVTHLERLFDVTPQVIAHDLHPDYLSSQFAFEAHNVRRFAVQHHHAHIASVLAEHGLAGPVIGLAFDGTGLGADGTLWGGEFLVADLAGFERAAYLEPVPLPGGEQAVRQPWRVAAAWLQKLYGDDWSSWPVNFPRQADRATAAALRQMIAQRINSPLTSSMGRLFDALAALLGLRETVTYEGQAAIELEAIADLSTHAAYPFGQRRPAVDLAPLFEAVLADLRAGIGAPVISARFHNAVAGLAADVCVELRQERGLNRVALSGGVFQNVLLLARTLERLAALGFETYTNQRVPPNDGGIAFGQAAVAAARLAKE